MVFAQKTQEECLNEISKSLEDIKKYQSYSLEYKWRCTSAMSTHIKLVLDRLNDLIEEEVQQHKREVQQ